MVGFQAIYRCRLCGEKFNGMYTRTSDIAFDKVLCVCTGSNFTPPPPYLYGMHLCADGSYGVGDFLGCKKIDK